MHYKLVGSDYLAQTDPSSQMLKGILQGCLLILINEKPFYGYSISQELSKSGFADIPKGTIYPLLISMEKKGLIWGKRQPSNEGPQRKYYYLTDAGKTEKDRFIDQWATLSAGVNNLIHKGSE
ncbi:PadR family transcriptional regulator [Lentilactobacillus kisonensis]|uniref:Transcriptional regulator, PadR family n=2 Tax=Lentilactobacillus kisonensis TaxID=481722 RepID=H1LHU5_9LACO|nr:transcriptional regulator, PadR family [Lentilactobacillus kisonensis F0435]KRL20826.1 transcriptional regulator, PadR family [Lentilactobacillus kisonensis DSM 19906 = JCM 15041]